MPQCSKEEKAHGHEIPLADLSIAAAQENNWRSSQFQYM
jgi:hypothetical protein